MKKRLRTLLIWIVISLVFQFSGYSYLESKVEAVTKPSPEQVITKTLTADIPGTNLENIQLSYAKDYLAYMQNGVFKVYNLVQKKVVFEKAPPSGSTKNMGVLNYEWLPDRNTLIYFYAHKNPNPVTTTVIQPPASSESSQSTKSSQSTQADKSTQSAQQDKTQQAKLSQTNQTTNSAQTKQPARTTGSTKTSAHVQSAQAVQEQPYSVSNQLTIQQVSTKRIQETSVQDKEAPAGQKNVQSTGNAGQSTKTAANTGQTGQNNGNTGQTTGNTSQNTGNTSQTNKSTSGISQNLPKTEDPNQKQNNTNEKDTKPIIVTHYNNPQLTDLYTLELPDSSDTSDKPDDRYNQTLSSFPAGGEITHLEFSTYTNLMYLAIKTESGTQLLRIDVMKDVLNLSRAGESIPNMAVSDQYGTLYIEAKSGKSQQIVLIDGWNRTIISSDPDYTILGDRLGTLYLGELKNGSLIKIMSLTETTNIKANPSLDTIWQGSIPFSNARVLIGASKQVIVYDHTVADIISNGNSKTVNLSGDANYISPDGAELAQLTKDDSTTHIELRPL